METFNIHGVEIFSAGTWNGDRFTVDDLNKMVEAYEKTKKGLRPFLKLGHDNDQKLLQKDGLPSAGWVDRVYVLGEKLMADFSDIPKKIYELIKAKAYRKVSVELFYNTTVDQEKFQYLLGAVALLGADTPGVGNLSDILAQYKNRETESLKIYKALDLEINDEKSSRKDSKMSKTENEIKLEVELKAKNDEIEAEKARFTKLEEERSGLTSELEELKKFKAEAEKEKQKLLAEAETAKIEKFVTELKSEKLVSPSMEGMVKELLGPEKKEYSLKIDKEDKKLSKEELLKEVLKFSKALSDVNFEESSEDGKKDAVANQEAELDKKAKEYAKENKVSYGTALKAVLKQK